MGNDAFRPITSCSRLPKPLNGYLYTTTRSVASEKSLPAIGGTMAAELGASSPHAANIIVGVTDGPDRSKGILTITHVRIPSEADQLLSSWESTKADIGGRKFDAGTTTVIVLASAASPASTAGAGPFGGYTADGSMIVDSGTQLEPVFRVVKTNWVKTTPMVSKHFDEATGGMITTTQTLVQGTDIGSGGMNGNTITEYQQITAAWYMITTRNVVSTELLAGRSYTTTTDYFWPAVLGTPFVKVDSWPLRKGGTDVHVMPVYARDVYRGPCKAVVSEVWSSGRAPTPGVPGVLAPLPIVISTPILAISIQPTLHPAIGPFNLSTGTDHPIYNYAGATFSFAATSPTDWPESIVVSDEVRPFRGGWLRTTVTAYRPGST